MSSTTLSPLLEMGKLRHREYFVISQMATSGRAGLGDSLPPEARSLATTA